MTGEVRCPKCGRRTAIRTAREDDRSYHVCDGYPKCKGRLPVAEIRDDWEEEHPAPARPRQRRESDFFEGEAETTLRKSRKDKREFDAVIKSPQRKSGVSIDEVWGDDWGGNWGDDWGKEKPAAKTTNDKPRQRREQASPKRDAVTVIRKPEKDKRESDTELNRPQRKGKVLIDEGWGNDWGKEIPVPKPAPYRPQYPRAQKRAVVPEEKKPARPPQRRVLKEEAAPEKKKPSKPLKQITPRQEATPEVKAPPKLRHRRVPQEYLVPEKKKRSNIVIIIALVIAFLAVDGIIYAAFVLR
jgi:ssDNA-binding Zn-finger/Zn-ribbon topoisomerase 1